MSNDLIEMAKAEVVNRHVFFVEWFTNRAPDSAMEASARAFAPDMVMIEPDANEHDSAAVVQMLRNARGKRPDDFEIKVIVRAARKVAPDLALVTYDEHQDISGVKSQRRSTALFSPDANAPEGVVWRHLQETWISE